VKAQARAVYCAKFKLDSERRLGAMLAEVPRESPGPRPGDTSQAGTQLQEATESAGLDRMTAHRFQRVAAVPDRAYERSIETAQGRENA